MTFIALDIGNSRTKYGFFPDETPVVLPVPLSSGADDTDSFEHFRSWFASLPREKGFRWHIAATNERRRRLFDEWFAAHRPEEKIIDLTIDRIPISMNIDAPDKIGIDRLLTAFGAIQLRRGESPLPFLVIDAGTATTVDLVSAENVFLGGAILPGLESSASALSRISPRLPKMKPSEISFAAFPGKNTVEALAAGIMGSAVGAIRHYHSAVEPSGGVPIYLTGGDAELIENGLRPFFDAELLLHVPNLVLSSIAAVSQNF